MTRPSFKLVFPAEIKQVSSKKLKSLDIEYRLILDSPDSSVMVLGQLAPDQLFNITVEAQ